MGYAPTRAALTRALATAAAAALALGSAAPAAAASDPPAVKAKRVKQETRYCVRRAVAGAPHTEKRCKTRDQWVRQDGWDPIRHR